MFKFFRFVSLMATIVCCTQLSKFLVESKALLCQPSPKWTVNNGTDPMAESAGNVTLVTLINASYRFGLKQASSLENMLRFLRKSGLKDINFIVINAKDLDAKQKFKDLSQKVSFSLYQETEEDLVWNVLDGGKDDMFIYDRCGLLTYYIPFPLSIIHAQQPILQAALLSTYFDNPCGESCDSIRSDTRPITSTVSPSSNASADITVTPRPLNLSATVVNITFDKTLSEDFNETKDNETIIKNIDLKDENLLEFQTTESNDSIIPEEYSGSGSGDQPIEDLIETYNESNVLNNDYNNSLDKDLKDVEDWKVLDFFKSNDNRSDKDIFEEIYNKSVIQLEVIANKTINSMSTEMMTTTQELSAFNESLVTMNPLVESTTVNKPKGVSFFKTASRTKCDSFNQSMCIEWSTDRLLKARLCCLSEVLADDDSGFGCGHFERGKCKRMLPLIKCCLKDFSQLLENYYQSIKTSPRPSRQRIRN